MADARESAGSSPSADRRKRREQQPDESGPSQFERAEPNVPTANKPPREVTERAPAELIAVGNKATEFIYSTEGSLGYRPFVKDLYTEPTFIELNPERIARAVQFVLESEIRDRLTKKGDITYGDVDQWSQDWAETMTHSVLLVIYQKLRVIHRLIAIQRNRFIAKVNVTGDLEVPVPYAFSVQQLGHVKIADVSKEMLVVPTYPENTLNFGTNPAISWSHAKHNRVVQRLKEIGIACTAIDVKKVKGSTWWLFRQVQTGSSIRLTCPLPEVNFHEDGAVLHSLYLRGEDRVLVNEIANLGPLGNNTYGLMLQNPVSGIQLCSFRALLEEDESQWLP